MSDFNLNETLKRAETPARTEEYWAQFPAQVVRQLDRKIPSLHEQQSRRARFVWGWITAAAAACVLIALAISQRHTSSAPRDALLQNEKLIRETMALFPKRLRAIVQSESGLSIVTSEEPDVPGSAPIYVRICDGNKCSAAVTFSGQEIQLDGQILTVLSDARGGVILVGEHFVWSNGKAAMARDRLKIQAKEIAVAQPG